MANKQKLNILFIVPYPIGKAASQRFRFEQYFNALQAQGHQITIKPFMSEKTWAILYLPKRFLRKALAIQGGMFRRLLLLFRLRAYDYIFVHRESTPIGPAFFEYVASKWLKKKLIFDFDDAIWIPNYSESNRFFSFLKGYANTKHICRWAHKVSCGNDFLCQFALQYNKDVLYNPTTIDTEYWHNKVKVHDQQLLTIGWTGSHSTVRYLYFLKPVLEQLSHEFNFRFLVISDIPPENTLPNLSFIKWRKETEIEDLLELNVGLMPLENDKWANGKCGFKALQYMALGIPAVVSPVGVNTRIVDHGINGLVAQTQDEWYQALHRMLSDRDFLQNLAKRSREKIVSHYSVLSNTANFLSLFDD